MPAHVILDDPSLAHDPHTSLVAGAAAPAAAADAVASGVGDGGGPGPRPELFALPDPDQMHPAATADLEAHLTRVETARQRQLATLPVTPLDAVTAAYRDTLERILAEVRTARARIASGLYGSCADCQVRIDAERLKLRPWAITCTLCADRAHVQRRGI